MKFLIASDIHGSAKYCRLLLEAFEREGADKLILLGDVLYHGPRNPLPEEYSPLEVVEMLNAVADKVICVRGNCDAEIDQSLLNFPLNDYSYIFVDGLNVHVSHGHRQTPPLGKDDVYVTGHTHVALNTVEPEGYYHLNPGSISIPKEDSAQGYIVYDNRKFVFKSLDGETYDSLEIPGGVVAAAPAVIRRSPVLHKKLVKRRR